MRIYENGECYEFGGLDSLSFNPRDVLSGGNYAGMLAHSYSVFSPVDIKECGHFCYISVDYSTCCTCHRERQSKCEICSSRRKEK